MQLFRFILPLLVAICLLFTGSPALAAPVAVLPGLKGVFTGTPPTDIGVYEQQLSACPTSPNCVSSSASDDEHYIAPIEYTAASDAVRDKLVAVLNNQPRTEIVEQTDEYIRVEFTSRLMGFVDDAEFYFSPDGKTVAIRSAARLGESDLGVNRRRLEQFRLALQSLGA
ncbi:pf07386 family protein [Leptolyngbya sp. Heron Island J]|uniref:DUF1499 domain-containing protein n=1 Tax=Leptolyngbya sp. Heron Island J TaxID=1385935 RepID=UPI0003B96130|nr:DUF1499 domain-containing protein [Leptolyngbya sp. Heron Island J]ESA33325.1 pf07386 family protein [Leptolyngbya sp. Heron Island J]